MVFDPEHVGVMLWQCVPVPTDDFQDLPSWRELVIETALALRRHHTDTLIVPMTLVNDDYQHQILAGIRGSGEKVLHIFLDLDADVLRQRIADQVIVPADPSATSGCASSGCAMWRAA